MPRLGGYSSLWFQTAEERQWHIDFVCEHFKDVEIVLEYNEGEDIYGVLTTHGGKLTDEEKVERAKEASGESDQTDGA